MNQLIAPLLTVVLTGLGFVTYKHPEIARKIISIVFAALFLLFVANSIFNISRMYAYYNAMDAVENVFKNHEKYFSESNSLFNESKYIEENDGSISADISKARVNLSISTMQQGAKGKLNSLLEKDRNTYYTFNIYFLVAFFILAVFTALSFVFDKMHETNAEKIDNETK
jgi:hypothetical protein